MAAHKALLICRGHAAPLHSQPTLLSRHSKPRGRLSPTALPSPATAPPALQPNQLCISQHTLDRDRPGAGKGSGARIQGTTPSGGGAVNSTLSPRRQQTLQWSASARRAPQVVLRFEKPPAFLSHRLVQLRLDRWQRKASRRIRDHRGWTPRRPALRRTPPNHHAGASSQRVSRCTPDGQRAPMAAWARRAPWPACRYEAQLLGRGAP